MTDIAFGLPGYTASNFPKTLLTELPGVIDPETGTEAIIENMAMLSDEYRRIQLLALWNNAPNLLLTADTPIRSLDDLSGLSIRVPSRNAGLMVEAWVATPVSMPAPEIYNAMQTGVIDGAMTDPSALDSFKLGEVTNYVTRGMDTTISSFFLIMNRNRSSRPSSTPARTPRATAATPGPRPATPRWKTSRRPAARRSSTCRKRLRRPSTTPRPRWSSGSSRKPTRRA